MQMLMQMLYACVTTAYMYVSIHLYIYNVSCAFSELGTVASGLAILAQRCSDSGKSVLPLLGPIRIQGSEPRLQNPGRWR